MHYVLQHGIFFYLCAKVVGVTLSELSVVCVIIWTFEFTELVLLL